MKQIYENYTAEDQHVWQLLFDRQMANLTPVASSAYLKAISNVEFKNTAIPNFDDTNKVLDALTGWSLHVVPGIIPGKEFFELLSDKKFCATTWLRTMNQLDYLEEPDMFHDVFGHVPLLSNAAYCKFFEGISRIALKHIDDEWAIELLGRIYWFTIEFGLIRENGILKIYGAGILSSPGETAFSLSDKVEHIDYNIDKIFDSSYRTDVYQTKYFIIDSFEQLYESIDEIEIRLEAHLLAKQVG